MPRIDLGVWLRSRRVAQVPCNLWGPQAVEAFCVFVTYSIECPPAARQEPRLPGQLLASLDELPAFLEYIEIHLSDARRHRLVPELIGEAAAAFGAELVALPG